MAGLSAQRAAIASQKAACAAKRPATRRRRRPLAPMFVAQDRLANRFNASKLNHTPFKRFQGKLRFVIST